MIDNRMLPTVEEIGKTDPVFLLLEAYRCLARCDLSGDTGWVALAWTIQAQEYLNRHSGEQVAQSEGLDCLVHSLADILGRLID